MLHIDDGNNRDRGETSKVIKEVQKLFYAAKRNRMIDERSHGTQLFISRLRSEDSKSGPMETPCIPDFEIFVMYR